MNQETDPASDIAISDEEELSYAEILASAVLNGEIEITIPLEDEERVKTGLKNYKSKQLTRMKEAGQTPDSSTLIFTAKPSADFTGCIDLSIQNKTKGTVKIKRLRIPENDFPD